MNTAFLCLGGNLGNRLDNLERAQTLITKKGGNITAISGIYETEAWGSNSHKQYLNQCLMLKTPHSAESLLRILLKIENELGRVRNTNQNADRTIDIDILLFNSELIESKNLCVPHPRMHLRRFVLMPLSEIAPNIKHPLLQLSIKDLLKVCNDKLSVHPFKPAKRKIICVEGNIGSGKTTIARQLSKTLKGTFVGEKFEHNPLLPLFYSNKKKYALPLETSFLLERFNQLHTLFNNQDNDILICDFSIYKCLWFAKANLSENDFKQFKKTFKILESELQKPSLIIYLDAETKELEKNIESRGRSYEQKISAHYLNAVNKEYKKGLKQITKIPQLHCKIPSYQSKTIEVLLKEMLKTISRLKH
jgi:deoxyguanosine kinase